MPQSGPEERVLHNGDLGATPPEWGLNKPSEYYHTNILIDTTSL
jgi:hypothetical protein